jgi:hypothetical protein
MTDDRGSMPRDWDALMDRGTDDAPPSPPVAGPDAPGPPALTVMAAAWADLVGILAVCTGALVAILSLGERPALPAFAWAAALGVVWWIFATTVLVVVRQATPGMLLAGVSFSEPVHPTRVDFPGSSVDGARFSVWRPRQTSWTAPRKRVHCLRRLKTMPM